MDYTATINDDVLEFIEKGHRYLVNGVLVPSVTTLLQSNKYDDVDRRVLRRAAEKGIEVHEAIENYCQFGLESALPEVRNFKFLQGRYGFNVVENEKPVILYVDGEPAAAGRVDMVIEIGGKVGGADIKRTATLDKQYLACQLNLYRIAYRQSYGVEWEFLKGIHLREDRRKFVDIPINEDYANQFIAEKLKDRG